MSREIQFSEPEGELPVLPNLEQDLFLRAIDGVVYVNAQGRYTQVNPRICELLGYSREELLALSPSEVRPDVDAHLDAAGLPALLAHQKKCPARQAYRLRRKDGTALDVEINVMACSAGGCLGIVRDVSEHRQAEEKLKRLTRMYAALSRINQAIIHIRDRAALFQTFCDVAVESGQFRLAWIGLLDHVSGSFAPVAHAGHDDGYLQQININLNDVPRNQGPTGIALRTGEIVIVDDIQTDPRIGPWREEALKRHYVSSAAVPFRLRSTVIGTLNLYSGEPGLFSADESSLLEETGQNISFALDAIAADAERKQMEGALRESENQYRLLFNTMREGLAFHEIVKDGAGRPIDYRFLQVNPAFEELTGLRGAEIIGKTAQQVLPNLEPFWIDTYGQVALTGVPARFENYAQALQKYYQVTAYSPQEGRFATLFEDITARKQTEQAIRESELKFRTYIEHAPVAVFVTDITGRYIDCNPAAGELLGYDVAMLIGMQVTDITLPEDLARVMQDFQFLISEGQLDREYRVRRGDGRLIWITLRAVMLDKEFALAFCRDITEHRQAEEALRESEERFRSIAEQMVDVLFVTATNGTIDYISPSAAQVFGWAPEEMVGQNFTRFLVPSEIPRAMSKFQVDIEHGRPARGLELRMKRKDGGVFWGELNAAARRRGGRAIDVIGLIRDISERKSAEQAIRESEARYRAIVEDQTELIIRWLPDTTLTFVNEAFCRFLGLQREQLLGRRFLPNVAPEDRESTEERVALLNEKHVEQNSEQRISLPSGEVRWVQWTDRVFSDEAGRVVEIQSVGRDITERKQMDLELQTRTNELEALFALSSALNIAQTESAMLPAVLTEVSRALKTDANALALYNPEKAAFSVALASGELAPYVGHVFSTTAFHELDVQRLMSGRPFIMDELGEVGARMGAIAGVENLGPAIFTPVQSQEQFLGILTAMRKKGAPGYDASAIRLLAAGGEMVGNALQRVRLHDQALARLQHLQILQHIVSAITGSFDLTFTLPLLAAEITSQTHVDAAAVLLFNQHTLILEYVAGRGFLSKGVEKARVRLGEGFAGRAALERAIVTSNNLSVEAAGNDAFVQMVRVEGFVGYNGVPLIVKGQLKGVLELYQRSPLPSDTEWFDFLKTLAYQAAIAINNVELFDGLQHSNLDLALAYDATIEGWSRAMDLRDRDTEGHTQRVTEITERLARMLGVGEAEIVNIRRGALLHDIGKMGVPDAILHKPDKLTEEEWKIMRMHPQYAYDMLWPIPYLRPAIDIPYCHHERWDGTGYPRGLKGEQIPLPARIFAVVDVWDALLNDRPYHAAWPADQVQAHIRSGAGAHFDPRVVEAFLKLKLDGPNSK
jgi:PAS domain S-box-containing protein